MSARRSSTSAAGFVAEAPAKVTVAGQPQLHVIEPLEDSTDPADIRESELRRRAHLQALALMVVSGLISALVLYVAWTLLRGVI